jgi:hypothetical protein
LNARSRSDRHSIIENLLLVIGALNVAPHIVFAQTYPVKAAGIQPE